MLFSKFFPFPEPESRFVDNSRFQIFKNAISSLVGALKLVDYYNLIKQHEDASTMSNESEVNRLKKIEHQAEKKEATMRRLELSQTKFKKKVPRHINVPPAL